MEDAMTICFGFAVIEKWALKDHCFIKRWQEGKHCYRRVIKVTCHFLRSLLPLPSWLCINLFSHLRKIWRRINADLFCTQVCCYTVSLCLQCQTKRFCHLWIFPILLLVRWPHPSTGLLCCFYTKSISFVPARIWVPPHVQDVTLDELLACLSLRSLSFRWEY